MSDINFINSRCDSFGSTGYNRFLYYQNVRGLKTKTNTFFSNILVSDHDIFCLTETWLDSSVNSSELFPDGFSVFRLDGRERCRGAGVLVAVRDEAWHATRLSTPSCDVLNLIWLKLTNDSNFTFYLCVVYFSPQTSIDYYLKFFNFFEVCHGVNIFECNVCIVGDFNLPQIKNSIFNLNTGGTICRELQNYLDFNKLKLYNDVLNVNSRTLDLVISNIPGLSVTEDKDALVPIDSHHPVLCLHLYTIKNQWKFKRTNETFYNFSRADFISLYRSLSQAQWQDIYSMSDLNASVDLFYRIFYSCLDISVPKISNRNVKYPVWYSSDIIKHLNKRNRFRREFLRTGRIICLNRYKDHRRVAKDLIKRAYTSYVLRMEDLFKLDPKQFWSFVKTKKSSHPSNANNFHWEEESYGDGQSVVSAFAKYFSSVYESDRPLDVSVALRSPVMPGVQHLNISCITPEEVRVALNKLPSKRSFGPDLIPPYIFKACCDILVDPLCHIFNLCLSKNEFPSLWKTTKIVPLHKKGDKFEITNFRPVAILSTPAKVFESILHRNILSHMKLYLSPNQHGFYPSRSIVSNLGNFIHFTSGVLDSKSQVDVIYTDFSKAFDKVNHSALLNKLNYYGFSDNLVMFFSSYLKDRKQFVSRAGYKSDLISACSGVPQGSNLGPLLFNIFINDLAFLLNCNLLMYADDLKLFSQIEGLQDCVSLQHNLDLLFDWCLSNRLSLNIDKCVVMSYYRVLDPVIFPFKIGNVQLKRTEQFTDLGVIMMRDLSFSEHIYGTVRKAYCTLGFIIRLSNLFREQSTLVLLFKSLVRSRLEFASVIWSPHTATLIDAIEKVQKKFLRYLYYRFFGPLNRPIWYFRYKEMLSVFQFDSLVQRRKIARLCFLRGVILGLVDDATLLGTIGLYTPRYGGRASRLLYPLRARTEQHANSFLNASVTLYNTLAEELDFTASLNCFKLRCYYLLNR